MRHVGDEVPADTLQLAQLGDVVQDDHDADATLVEEAMRLGPQHDLAADRVAEDQLPTCRLGLRTRLGEQGIEIRDAHGLPEQRSLQLLRGEELASGEVGERDPVVLVDRHDALDHAREHRAQAILFARGLPDALRDLDPQSIQGVAEDADLVRREIGQPGLVMAAAQAGRGPRDLRQRPRQAVGEVRSQCQSPQDPEERHEQQPPAHRPELLVEIRE